MSFSWTIRPELTDDARRLDGLTEGESALLTRAHCMPYVGQHVAVRCRDGAMHYGMLQSVTNDGIYIRPMQGGNRVMSGTAGDGAITLNRGANDLDAGEAFFPFLFLPFFALAALSPWAFLLEQDEWHHRSPGTASMLSKSACQRHKTRLCLFESQ